MIQIPSFPLTKAAITVGLYAIIGTQSKLQTPLVRTLIKSSGETWGGLSGRIALKPGDRFKTYVLLNGWTHLLCPGKYSVQCKRILSLDTSRRSHDEKAPPRIITIEQSLTFEVEEYDRNRVQATLKDMESTREINRDEFKFFSVGKPIEWAYADVANKFQMGLSYNDAKFKEQVLSRLPKQWDNTYYLEYSLESNRNWLTAKVPEDFVLTFSVRNNSNRSLLHGLMLSRTALDGTDIPQWPYIMKTMLENAKLGNTIEPGRVIKLSRKFNDVLTNAKKQRVTWKVQSFTMETEVATRR